ncbi:MAG TPA: cellulase family glycosylhydrolase [Solirubrobacterales bacterium]|nr:cellulase family glycosylhydrolase [Solirubrobacterales bacterium]
MLGPIKSALLLLSVTGALLGTTGASATAAAPDLRVVGSEIRDQSTGTEFIPRGVNWPSFEYACVQGWGYSNLGATRDTAEAMLEWKINTVRIPLNQDCWLGDDDQPRNELFGPELTPVGYRNAVAAFVGILRDAGIAVILDLHWTGRQGTIADGLRPMADNRSDDFWISVASRFSTEPSVIFDLFNEPHSRWDPAAQRWAFEQTWHCWTHGGCTAPDQPDTETVIDGSTYQTVGMKTLVDAVRSTGATQPIILGGLDYANDLRGWKNAAPADGQLIAGFHNYPGKPCGTNACWNGVIAALARNVPVLTAEVGQNDCQATFISRYMDWADRHGIGYLAWAWWDLSGTILDPGPGCSNFALIEDLDGTPTPAYGAAFKEHLQHPLDEEPEPPPPPEPEAARLSIVSALVRGRKVRATFRINPLATGRLVIHQMSVKGRRGRKIRATAPIRMGRSQVVMPVRRGWKPKRIFVSYPGSELVLSGKSNRRLKGG